MSEWVRLGDVFNLQMGKTPSRSNLEYWNNGDYDWVSISDLSEFQKYVGRTKETISELGVKESGIKTVPPNTVIMSFKLSIGKTAITVSDTYTNEAIMAFLPKEAGRFNIDYLYYLLSGTKWTEGINRAVMGTTLNKKTLSEKKIQCPSLSEQQHIVSVLDNVNSLIDVRKKQIALLDEAEKSLFVEMFGDPLENPKGWDILSFSDIAVFDTRMTTDFEKYADVPHIGIENIESVTGRLVNYKLVKDSNLISGKYVFTPKHIIYSKIRPNLNKVAIPNFDGLCSADAYPILPKDNCLKDFLVFILRSKFFISFILRQSDRANIPKVNKKQIQEFKMPLPPLSLQKEFAARISAIEERRREMEAGLQQMEEARSALMQEYFGC